MSSTAPSDIRFTESLAAQDMIPREPAQTVGVVPTPVTRLVGRHQEVAAVLALLANESTRLLTLTGPGGVGKTRLAVRIAAELGDAFANGIVFVSLAPIADPALIPAVIAREFGVRESGESPVAGRLQQTLRSWAGLLILDNFEQVIPAAPFLANLLGHCPRLKILVTSRSVLHISGEREFVVPPLALPVGPPSVQTAEASDAVALFLQRALAVRSSFALTTDNVEAVVDICRRLDGLPLAIELAAARSKVLAPAALLARLSQRLQFLTHGPRDQPSRLQTMRAAIEWSHDLLTPDEQTLFRHLSVFAGGFTLDAAEAVCGTEGTGAGYPLGGGQGSGEVSRPVPCPLSPVPSVLDGVASLVDKSLLGQIDEQDGEPRFTLLETVREFGLERLAVSGDEPEVRRRHARHFLALAELDAPSSASSVQEPWLARLQTDHANIRQALDHFATTGDASSLLRLVGALAWFWSVHAHFTEGLHWLDEALRHDDGKDPSARAKALLVTAWTIRFRGESERALALAEESLALYRAIGDEVGIADASTGLGFIAYGLGDHERTARHGEEVLQIQRQRGDHSGIGVGLMLLAHAAIGRGDPRQAAAHFEDAATHLRAVDDRYWLAHTLSSLGYAYFVFGEHGRAAEALGESLPINWRMGNKTQTAWCLFFLALVTTARGYPEQAARLIGAETALRNEVGAFIPPVERQEHEQTVAGLRAQLGAESFDTAFAAGATLPQADAVAEALAVAEMLTLGATARPAAATVPFDLTQRELDILRLLVEGRSDREMGDALFISHRTAQKHVANIFVKLGVGSRTAAATVALRTGLVPTSA